MVIVLRTLQQKYLSWIVTTGLTCHVVSVPADTDCIDELGEPLVHREPCSPASLFALAIGLPVFEASMSLEPFASTSRRASPNACTAGGRSSGSRMNFRHRTACSSDAFNTCPGTSTWRSATMSRA